MRQRVALLALLLLQTFCVSAWSDDDGPEIGGSQNKYEKEIQAVVRNKRFYKSGKVELAISAGLLPYDSLFDHYLLGGRLAWHISDHYGWEIVDFQKPFGSVTSFTTSLASNPTKNIAVLQALQLNNMVGTSFLASPFYGKIRFFGAQVVYLDVYLALGLGMVNTTTHEYNHTASSTTFSQTVAATGWDLSLNYGVGFKFFLGNAFSLYFDMRNYMSNSVMYGNRALRSNFTVTGGFSFFLPNFG